MSSTHLMGEPMEDIRRVGSYSITLGTSTVLLLAMYSAVSEVYSNSLLPPAEIGRSQFFIRLPARPTAAFRIAIYFWMRLGISMARPIKAEISISVMD